MKKFSAYLWQIHVSSKLEYNIEGFIQKGHKGESQILSKTAFKVIFDFHWKLCTYYILEGVHKFTETRVPILMKNGDINIGDYSF